jgi:uncharacterized phiE125 gp8 family phage protein
MIVTLMTPPRLEPVTLAEAKKFLRIDHGQEDDLLMHLIRTAREMIEREIGRHLILQKVSAVIPFRPQRPQGGLSLTRIWAITGRTIFYVPTGPLRRLIKVDLMGEQGDFREVLERKIHLNTAVDPALLILDVLEGWGVRLIYEAGYGEGAEDVPAPLRQAILIMVTNLYENREAGDHNIHEKCGHLLEGFRSQGRLL